LDTSKEPPAIIKNIDTNEYLYCYEFNTWLDAVHFVSWVKINNFQCISNSFNEWSEKFGYNQTGIFNGNHLEFSGSNYQWKIIVESADFEYIDNNDDIYEFHVWEEKVNNNFYSLSTD